MAQSKGGPREGAGRPAIDGKVLVRLGPLLPRVDAYAAAQETSRAFAIRQLIELSLLEWEQEQDMEDMQAALQKITPRFAYEKGCGQGNRAYSLGELHGFPARMNWRPGRPEVSEAEVRADALDTFAVRVTQPGTDFRDALPAVRELPGLEELAAEYQRGFMEHYRQPVPDPESRP